MMTKNRFFSLNEARRFLALGLPVLVTQIAQMGMNFVDTAMTGQASTADMAAVAVSGSIWVPVSLLGMGCLLSLPAMMAHLVGGGEQQRTPHLLRQGLWLSSLLSLVLMGVFAFLSLHLELFGLDAELAPLAALLAREAICCFVPGDQGGTYNGNPLMTAVGVAVMQRMLAPGFLAEVTAKGQILSQRLLELSAKRGLAGERGSGLLRALILDDERGPEIVQKALALTPCGLLLNSPRPNLLRFMPALNVSVAEIDQMIGLLDGLLAK